MQFNIRVFTSAVPTPPVTAPVLSANAFSPTRIDVGLVTTSTGGVGGYTYELDGSADNAAWSNITTNATFPYSDSGLSALQLKYYRARGRDSAGTYSVYSASVNATTPAIDTTPDPFTFVDQTNVALSTAITSAAITVQNINSPATITVSGGTYDINASGSFTSSSGTVNSGDTVRARVTSSASNSTAANCTVTIGGVSDTFTATTLAASGSFDYYISPTGNTTTGTGAIGSPWGLDAINLKRSTYRGKRVGLMSGTYNCALVLGFDSDAPGLNIDGGTAVSSTIIQSVTPLGAIMDGGNTFSSSHKGPLFGHYPGTSQRGYVELLDVVFTRFKAYLLVNYGLFNTHEALPGMRIAGCWFHDNSMSGQSTDNVECITINECAGAIVENNVFEDCVGVSAGSCDHLAACLMWQGSGTIFRYNTVINAGTGFYAKEVNHQGNQVYGNYIDCGMYTSAAFAIQDGAGWATGGLTQTTHWHHNVAISSVHCLSAVATLNTDHGYTTPVLIYNNVVVMTTTAATSECMLDLRSETAGNGLAQIYNNIFTGEVSGDNKMLRMNAAAAGKFNYNLMPSSPTIRLVGNGGSGGVVADYTTIATARAGIAANGGVSDFQLAGVANNTPGFTGTGSLAARYQLALGSPALAVGRSDGTSGGSVVDMGIGGNSPPSQIGASFTGNYS